MVATFKPFLGPVAVSEQIVEIFTGGVWVDITADVRLLKGIDINRQPGVHGSCNLTIDNSSHAYSSIPRNTPIRVRETTPSEDVNDPFARTSVNSWGATPSGQTYTLTVSGGGSASDFDVAAGVGTLVVGAANSYRLAWLPGVSAEDGTALLGPIDLPTAAVTGGALEPANIAVRMQNNADYYLFRVQYTTAENLRVLIFAPGGAVLVDSLAYNAGQWTPGEDIMFRAQWIGDEFKARVWPASVAEPAVWHAEATDHTYLGPGGVGVRGGVAAGNTNVPATFGYGSFTVSTSDTLFYGQISERPTRWNLAGTDITVPIEAAGPLRQLSQGAKALRSAIYRAIVAAGPVAYWPLEDGLVSTQAASGLLGGVPLGVVLGAPGFGSSQKPVGSAASLQLALPDTLRAPVTMSPTGEWSVEVWLRGEPGTTTSTNLSWTTPGGTVAEQWTLTASPISNALRLSYESFATGTASSTLLLTASPLPVADGAWRHVVVSAEQVGSDTRVALLVDGAVMDVQDVAAEPTAPIAAVQVGSGTVAGDPYGQVNHLAIWDQLIDGAARDIAGAGHAGERAAVRIGRLCAEENVPVVIRGDASATAPMGPQGVDTFVNLLRQAEAADRGILYELRNAPGVDYRTVADLYNQTPVTLDYAGGHVAERLDPVDDDALTHNDVTAKRTGGSEYRHVVTAGPLSTLPPQQGGVGTYDRGPVEVNVAADGQLSDVAGWVAHLGTWDESRYPSISVNLAAPDLEADPALSLAVSRADAGDLVQIDNLPAWVLTDPILAIVRGAQTRHTPAGRTVEWTATPGGPYTVFVLDDATLGVLDTSRLAL